MCMMLLDGALTRGSKVPLVPRSMWKFLFESAQGDLPACLKVKPAKIVNHYLLNLVTEQKCGRCH